jgi:polysaccharide export outer membrane protein
MRLTKVLIVLMLAPAVGGCASLPPPRATAAPAVAAASQPTKAGAASLDKKAHGDPAPQGMPAAVPVATPAAAKPTPFAALARLFERRRPAPVAELAAPVMATPAVAAPQPTTAWAANLDNRAYGDPAPIAAKPTPFSVLARLFERRRPAPVAVLAAPVPTDVVAVPVVLDESEAPYALDTGDRLRIVVFGQEGLSNSYTVDAQGNVSMPLIGTMAARAHSTEDLSRLIAERLRRGFIREPHVSIEVEIYRPFFIMGEVIAPGQYPYVPHMTAETAVAIAGGFTPRAYRRDITLDRPAAGGVVRRSVPPLTRVRPGDTIIIKERWF